MGRSIDFESAGARVPGYLATPDGATGPGVVVLHAWWGLTEPFRAVCDRLAEAGFAALAPDLYRGKTTASVEDAEALGAALDLQADQWRGDIRGAVQFLRQRQQGPDTSVARPSEPSEGRGKLALLGFSLGGAYALDMSVQLADEITAVATFYAAYSAPDFRRARAAYLCHFAEDDPFVSSEEVVEMEQTLSTAGRQATVYTYPGTKHWFFESNRSDAYDADAADLAWQRTLTFLNTQLRGS